MSGHVWTSPDTTKNDRTSFHRPPLKYRNGANQIRLANEMGGFGSLGMTVAHRVRRIRKYGVNKRSDVAGARKDPRFRLSAVNDTRVVE